MTTFWTDLRFFEWYGEAAVADTLWHTRAMPDYGYGVITVGNSEKLIRPEDTVSKREQQKAWLVRELARQWAGKTVVVTHHAPSCAVIGGVSELSPFFASNLEAEIERYKPDVWLFGHTHRAAERRMPGGTLLRNVSVGYEEELRGVDLEERVRRGLIDLGPHESGSAG
ncbi:metallophosphoesterase [Sulfitobacter sp. F26169L]|uniref:metallophosphoesterase family protein n=1 Tax=Sulfitobacter sp. F26169L TaxID=2996015 RepID=UPI002260C3BB|nr:metallophosphoesterase [Sulfitobacter sp. F26169L]MCX7568072.1 metallophosphoesterase [Sulfitobacter sp. F26169L]